MHHSYSAAAQLSTLVITVFLATSLAMPLSCDAASVKEEGNADPSSRTSEVTNSERSADLILKALALLGAPYKYGGTSLEKGFDCSGLVSHVFAAALGVTLPRRSEQISHLGQQIEKEALQPGDLVFFNTLRRTFSHVGIYLGGQRFIHAPSRGGEVRIDNMNEAYWFKRFNGARRIEFNPELSAPLVLQSAPALQTP